MLKDIHDRKVTLFILKEDRDLYAFSDDKKIVMGFINTREMDNFIIKEKRMDDDEYDAFVHCNYNSSKILNTDYLYDGTNTFEFPMTTEESLKLEVKIDDIFRRVGDNKIILMNKVFRGKYKKSLENILAYVNSFYYSTFPNNDCNGEINSLNVFIKLFGFTMMKLERVEDNELY
nr:MAG TPA: hypothetical protein [Caudoviricetes sp.]